MTKYCYYRDASGMVSRYRAARMAKTGDFLTRDQEWLPPTVGAKLYAVKYARELREHVTPESTLYMIERNTSRSGMTRAYDIYIILHRTPVCITHAISAACGLPLDSKGYISIRGCGFSGEHHIADRLQSTLWPYHNGKLDVRVM